jgi:hypothetical protein
VVFPTYAFSQAGVLNFTADWTSAANDIDIAVANGSCTSDQLSVGLCTFKAVEDSETLKPEELNLAIDATTYTPLIANFTAPTENITYRILFTPSASLSQSEVRAFMVDAAARLRIAPVLVRAQGKLRR